MNHIEYPLNDGEITFTHLDEGEYRRLTFNPPVVINWSMYESLGYQNPNDDSKKRTKMVYVYYDFGLSDKFKPYESIKKGWRYAGITEETPIEEIVKAFVEYDLCHAFFHYSDDPNYSHLHWAIYGNLKDRIMLVAKNYGIDITI